MIETESNTTSRNPVPWLTPTLVMWSTVAIVIALIVLGTWLNHRRVMHDTRTVRESFARTLGEFAFTAEQRTTLEAEFEKSLAAASSGEARRAMAKRIDDRLTAENAKMHGGVWPSAEQVFETLRAAIIECREEK